MWSSTLSSQLKHLNYKQYKTSNVLTIVIKQKIKLNTTEWGLMSPCKLYGISSKTTNWNMSNASNTNHKHQTDSLVKNVHKTSEP